MSLQTIELHPAAEAVATIIILHGLGADGTDFLPVADELKLGPVGPVRFLLPRRMMMLPNTSSATPIVVGHPHANFSK